MMRISYKVFILAKPNDIKMIYTVTYPDIWNEQHEETVSNILELAELLNELNGSHTVYHDFINIETTE